MSDGIDPTAESQGSLLLGGTLFFHHLEEQIEGATEASNTLEKRIRRDRLALGLDPSDDSSRLENHRICDMVSARMYLDLLQDHLATFERYWIAFADRIPQSPPE